MASISLRAYQQKIENLVDRGQTEEAVAHCKHILKLFPKHVDTYRLLGKSYLEMQHFQEAGDVLQRVLSVFPDDFISQIGLSIIRENFDNLDQSIWHMERAFEIQPSNNAVQEELKRLYGRRDGVVPQKILLTRGALVRMYVRGEAYPQAIAEGIAALQEDKQRTDIELLLAKSYLRTNQINEAFRLCLKILQTLPYAYEANQLMAEMHILTKQNDQAEPYFERIQMLDPYAAFVNENTPTSTKVDENAVVLEELDKDAISMDMSLQKSDESALFIDDSMEELDFHEITSFDSQESSTEFPPESTWITEPSESADQTSAASEEDDEAFLQSLMSADEPSEFTPSKKPEVAPISIPEFLQSMTTVGTGSTNGSESKASTVIPEVTPLSTIQDIPETSEKSDSEDLPDWLKQLDQETRQADIELDLQNEIDSLFTEDGTINASSPEKISTDQESPIEDDQFTSMFLDDLENASQLPGKTRMFSMTAKLAPESGISEFDHSENQTSDEVQESEVPEWLKELDQSNRLPESMKPREALTSEALYDPAEAKGLDFSEDADEDEMARLEFSRRQQSAIDPSPRANLPSEEDDAFSWLESLAAKQGAAEDSLLSEQSERPDTPPAWVLQESGQSTDDLPVEDQADVATQLPETMFFDEVESSPLTISSLEQEFPRSEDLQTSMLEENDLETAWVDEFEETQPDEEKPSVIFPESEAPEIPVAESRSADIAAPQTPDEIPAWLKDLEEQTSIYAFSSEKESEFDEDVTEFESAEEEAAKEPEESVPQWLVPPSNIEEGASFAEIQESRFFEESSIDEIEFEETTLPDQFESISKDLPLNDITFESQYTDQEDAESLLEPIDDLVIPVEKMEQTAKPEIDQMDHVLTFDVPDDLIEGLFQDEESLEPVTLYSKVSSEPDFKSSTPGLNLIEQIQELFNSQNYEQAFLLVDELIDEENLLEEVIEELSKVIYDHPLDPGIYIRLGDAYIRNNEIQKALDMYQEAENLLQK